MAPKFKPPEPVKVTIKGKTYEFYVTGLKLDPHGGPTPYVDVSLTFLVNDPEGEGLGFILACRDSMFPEELGPDLKLIPGGAGDERP
jgi:hypothetical protein